MFIPALVSVLMMLSHSRFVPDVSLFLQPRSEAPAALSARTTLSFHLPGESNPHFRPEMLRGDEKIKLKNLLRRSAQSSFYREKIKRQGRVSGYVKRYLLFGQLRADG